MKKSVLPDLFLTFLKIGLFTFGGGYAMISIIEHDCVEKKRWITHDEMMNLTVIAESTPGPIAINCATYIGYQQAGLIGAAAATFAIVLPSFAIIYLICKMLDHFLEITVIANAFRGIQIAVGILIADVALHMIRKMPKDFADPSDFRRRFWRHVSDKSVFVEFFLYYPDAACRRRGTCRPPDKGRFRVERR